MAQISIARHAHKWLRFQLRLTTSIFAPLAGPARELSWKTLLLLYDRLFGPDAEPCPDGIPVREVYALVGEYVSNHPEFVAVDDEADLTPADRAKRRVQAFVESGWLERHLVGAVPVLSLRPVAGLFLELVRQFVEEGPKLIAGKVQAIYFSLQQVVKDPETNAPAFMEAANEARNLITTLNNAGVRVRDLIEALAKAEDTRSFVETFFEDYVSSFFISDYHELRTTNHPLHHRNEILEILLDLTLEPERLDALRRGYRKRHKALAETVCEERMEQDIQRLRRFESIDVHLDRLDDNVRRATRQGVAMLHYRIRTPTQIRKVLEQAGHAALAREAMNLDLHWHLAPGFLLDPNSLAMPKVPRPERPRAVIEPRPRDPMAEALAVLSRIAAQNRAVTTEKINEYAQRVLGDGPTHASACPIDSISDLLVIQVLSLTAWITRFSGGQAAVRKIIRLPTDLRLTLVDGDVVSVAGTIELQNFRIERIET